MVRPRSMSMPPEASAPVFTVRSPSRIGSPCARTMAGKPRGAAPAAAPAALRNFLRLNVMVPRPPRLGLLRLNDRISRLGRQARRGRQAELPAHEVRSQDNGNHLVKGVTPAHALAAHAAIGRQHQALRRNVLQRLADESRYLLRCLHLQGMVIDYADAYLLFADALADQLEVHAARTAGLEGDHVGIDLA